MWLQTLDRTTPRYLLGRSPNPDWHFAIYHVDAHLHWLFSVRDESDCWLYYEIIQGELSQDKQGHLWPGGSRVIHSDYIDTNDPWALYERIVQAPESFMMREALR